MLTDLRDALRRVLRSPGPTIVAVLMLGLGIGASAAVLSLLASALTSNAPGIAAPDRLVVLSRAHSGSLGFHGFSHPDYCDYRDRSRSFAGLAAYANTAVSLTEGDQPERLPGAVVTANYFDVLGVAAGFGALPADTVVVSHSLWQRRFGGRPSLVGERLRVNGRSYTVAAVAPQRFQGTELDTPLDVWVPLAADSESARPDPWSNPRNRRDTFLVVIGRLKPGIAIGQAASEVATIGRQLALEYPKDHADSRRKDDVTLDARVALGGLTRGIGVYALSILMGVVALVLAIACANVANFLLVRAARRTRDTFVRLALGAGRARMVRPALFESLILSLAGGVIGLVLAFWIARLIPVALKDLGFLDARLDGRMAGFILLLSITAGCLSGLVPAVQSARSSLSAALKGSAGACGSGRLGVRGLLVVSEVCLAVIVLVGAGLLVGSARNLARVDKGFSSDHVLLLSIDPARIGYDPGRRLALYRQLFASLNDLPGVTAATLAGKSAMSPDFAGRYVADGLEARPEAHFDAHADTIAPRYFELLGIPLAAGRDFTLRDVQGAPRVVIVNQALAERQWPGESPFGKRLRMAGLGIGPPLDVVGVARNARQLKLEEAPAPFVYLPLFQQNADHVRVHVRSAGDPGAAVAPVQRAILALDTDLAVYDVESLDDHIADELSLLRSFASLCTAFGALALVLATVGLYVVMSCTVTQRTREIGLRVAVGASHADVLSLVLGQSMKPVLIGLATGILGALALTSVLQEALYGLSAADPATYVGASLLLALVATAAAYVPAQRAMRIDPMTALREE